jgi:carbon-monoxide dehydrogenase small subunit
VNVSLEDLLQDSVLLRCRVNGRLREHEIHPGMSLLEFVREELGLTGTHMGCQTGHCGACTVLVDGRVAKSCITPAASAQGSALTTLEGLCDAEGKLHPVQQAFWDAGGFQCAYCAPGMILTTTELLARNAAPNDEEIRRALSGNLCRCTGYQSLVRAVRAAAAKLRDASSTIDPAS